MATNGRRRRHPFLRLVVFLSSLVSAAFSPAAAQGDAAVIADLAKSLANLPPSWKPGGDPCRPRPWDGLSCAGGGRVTGFNLPRQSLTGTLPASIASLSSLRSLQLQGNAISGPLPSLKGLAALERLALDGNGFTAVPPDFLSGLSSLQYLSLDDIPFAPWEVPDSVADCAALSVFSAANASIMGAFPDALAKLSSLQLLRLSYNNLSGGLPAGLAGSGIVSLQLNNQKSGAKLSGPIDVVASMPSLQLVWLQSNAFSGPIPDLNMTGLESFNVRDNQLTGVVPASLALLPSLKNVSLSNNKLQGPVLAFRSGVLADVSDGNGFCSANPGPCDAQVTVLLAVAGGFGYPVELAGSWTGNDPCSGWVGVTCDSSTKAVTVINLASRNFSGTISPAIANLTSLTRLILSNNRLAGVIPDSLTTLPQLQLLDVTNNSLTGDKPKFGESVKLMADGNRFGESGGGDGSGSSSSDGSSFSPFGGSSRSKSGAGMIIGIIVALVFLVACSVGLFLHYRRKRNIENFKPVSTKSPVDEPEMVNIRVVNSNVSGVGANQFYSHASSDSTNITNLFESQGMHMSIEALLKATNNFDEDSILGKGGFGVVYRGNLNGTLVAVKRSDSGVMGTKGQQEFMAEIDVLRKVRHRHLVALLGYCSDGKERLLVYEYMSGSTLGQYLYDRQQNGYPPLTWAQRMTIAVDVARGIEYLHGLAQETFIHRDLKPSNILLDQDMRAKVSDFGLVKLAKDIDKSMMTRVAGTFGYLAPEYATTGKVTTKVDVYAYGVILMEIITGRKVLDDTVPDEDTHLVPYFRRNLLDREQFMKSVDPSLDLDDEAWKSLMEVADLARHCTAREPFQRPDMCHCVNRLSSLTDQWKPTTIEEEDEAQSSLGLNQRLEKWRSDDFSMTDSFSTFNIPRKYH